MQEEVNPYIRSNMVDYLTELFQNVCDFGWQTAKRAHFVVMTKLEGVWSLGQIFMKIHKIRKTYVLEISSNTNFTGDAS